MLPVIRYDFITLVLLPTVLQGMLDFDFVCSRATPSVSAMVYPFTGDHKQKFYWGHNEVLIPGTLFLILCYNKNFLSKANRGQFV